MSYLQAIYLGIIIAIVAITWGSTIELLTSSSRLGALAFWGTALLWVIWFLTDEWMKKKKRSHV